MSQGQLERKLGVSDAVVIGAGSMIGAGVFAAWAPAAEAAGNGLLIALAVAAAVAFANATSSAQLAAIHPVSGGTYVYGRRQLGEGWGHLAGWGFVVGKTCSRAAMALTVGAYMWPGREQLVAALAVVGIAVVNIGGLSRTVAVTKVLLAVSLAALAVVVVTGWTNDSTDLGRLAPVETDPLGVLRAAGFMFFAFAGYARIATLGEEVREPAKTIPRAIPLALGLVLVVYVVVGVTAIAAVDIEAMATGDAPLRQVLLADGSSDGSLSSLIARVGAGIAALGVLLNLIPGISRVVLAMARNGELPRWFSHIDGGRSLPLRAELAVTVVAVGVVLILDLRSAIAVSGVAVLTYYAVTNAAAISLSADQRRWPIGLAVAGLVGCLVLILALPASAFVGGLVVLASGVVVRRLVPSTSSGWS